jgi:hypothetical protein
MCGMKGLPAKSKPNILPMTYVEAKASLTKCERVDECKQWADKAKALASYAKQMKDQSLENMAQRIRDRAVRRGGELLLQVKAARGGGDRGAGRRSKDGNQKGGTSPLISRKAAAKKAGLSPDQAKQMVRTAKVPPETFESMVEAPKPATVEQLADIGTKKSERVRPEPYRNEWLDWTHAVAHLALIPACGLDVLAARRPDAIQELREECAGAISNLNMWCKALEAIHVSTRENGYDDRTTARDDQSSAA